MANRPRDSNLTANSDSDHPAPNNESVQDEDIQEVSEEPINVGPIDVNDDRNEIEVELEPEKCPLPLKKTKTVKRDNVITLLKQNMEKREERHKALYILHRHSIFPQEINAIGFYYHAF